MYYKVVRPLVRSYFHQRPYTTYGYTDTHFHSQCRARPPAPAVARLRLAFYIIYGYIIASRARERVSKILIRLLSRPLPFRMPFRLRAPGLFRIRFRFKLPCSVPYGVSCALCLTSLEFCVATVACVAYRVA
jgi:hypothetical protein